MEVGELLKHVHSVMGEVVYFDKEAADYLARMGVKYREWGMLVKVSISDLEEKGIPRSELEKYKVKTLETNRKLIDASKHLGSQTESINNLLINREQKERMLSRKSSRKLIDSVVILNTILKSIDDSHIKQLIDAAKMLRESLKAKKVILYFGRLIKRKGVDYLIRAFAKLAREYNDVVLIIAGEGDEKRNLQDLCRELNIYDKVHFTGFVKEEDKAMYFIACDVFVCPSVTLGMPEIWGIVVNEAMSVGKPVIATTAVGSAYDLVKNGINGFIVPERDIDALYRAMKLILGNNALMIRMGKESRKIIEKEFTPYHAFQSLDKVIKFAVSKFQR